MKYLLTSSYVHFTECDGELFTNSKIVGEATTETEAIDLVKKDMESQINDDIECELLEGKEEIEDFRKLYDVSFYKIGRSNDKMECIALLRRDSEWESIILKYFIIKM